MDTMNNESTPVTLQPTSEDSRQQPAAHLSGLELLTQLAEVLVDVKHDDVGCMGEWSLEVAFTDTAQQILYVIKDSGRGLTDCCESHNSDVLRTIEDASVLILERGSKCVWITCFCCCIPGKLSMIKVYDVTEHRLLGSVERDRNIWNPTIDIRNEAGNVMLRIKKLETISTRNRGDTKLSIQTLDDSEVGTVTIERVPRKGGKASMNFPCDLDVETKTLILSAIYLQILDFIAAKLM